MLTKRTNVLLSDTDYAMLSMLSSQESKTMGELIRYAVQKTYKTTKKALTANEEAFREVKKLTKGMNFTGIDYKSLVNYGRKY